jgi:hypothetical protein
VFPAQETLSENLVALIHALEQACTVTSP